MRTELASARRRIAATITLVAFALPGLAFAAEGEGGALLAAHTDIANHASLQRGARNFINYCSGCHAAQYMRYNRIGADLGIPDTLLRENLIFSPTAKVSDTIRSAMPPADAVLWFGVAPPDLSLIARARGADYLYTFLKSFYADPSRPTGVDNLVLKGTAMPPAIQIPNSEMRYSGMLGNNKATRSPGLNPRRRSISLACFACASN